MDYTMLVTEHRNSGQKVSISTSIGQMEQEYTVCYTAPHGDFGTLKCTKKTFNSFDGHLKCI